MPSKAVELITKCDHFLSTYDPSSLPRVALRGMQPVLNALKELLSVKHMHGVEIHHYPVASNPSVTPVSMQHVYVDIEGNFVTMLSSMPMETPGGIVFVWARPPVSRSIEDLVELGITPYQLVEYIKRLSDAVITSDMVNMPPAQA